MPTNSKTTSKKSVGKKVATKKSVSLQGRFTSFIAARKKAIDSFMARRPHRSFRLTRRRDYARALNIPGYISFTHSVNKTVWGFRKLFIPLAIIYIVLYALLVGIGSQDTYSALSQTLGEATSEVFDGDINALGQAGVVFLSIATSGAMSEASESQQIFLVFIFILTWLATVWLLRNSLAGHKVKLRDGLYNSGSPIFSTIVIIVAIALQLIPAAAALVGYSAAESSGLTAGGAASMLFWIGAGLLVILSAYWITSSLFAMIIVTIPGMYPYTALKTADDLVLGRRVRILLRWVWMILVVAVSWALVIIPSILIDQWVKSLWPAIEWIPIVPVAILLMGSLSAIWIAAYVYLFYRKVVDSGSEL